MADKYEVFRFVVESNAIEGIRREPAKAELEVTEMFLELPFIKIEDLQNFVNVCQPGAELRSKPGMSVTVGNHIPPRGGPSIKKGLENLLERANGVLRCKDGEREHPYVTHLAYETLHPFMDGNGRSGRALWAWQMRDIGLWPGITMAFLHPFYYQALEYSRR